ncbi:hypothetical protein [Actinocorallia populi]|uniref:hypothetical protein n=1 Tax=Actinocorallia populi TaxID=2079200 RepID=UPI0013004F4D|nr:hypothetical protein [Actinocorallia populi]
MRHGGDDDYGLPRVDVVVPDDARELDADVAAWRREEKEKRRRERLRRLLRPLTRHGLALPVLALTVVLALVSGVLITFFGPRPLPQSPAAPLASPTAAVGSVGGSLPDVRVVVNATSRPAETLRPALLVILPPECGCERQLHALARQAVGQSLRFYLLADLRKGDRSVQEAHRDLRPVVNRITEAVTGVVDDPQNALAAAYRAQGLTVVTVRADGLVSQVLRDLGPEIHSRLIKV